MRNTINLLPPSFRRQQVLRNRVYQWGAVVSVALLVAWVSHWFVMHEHRILTQRLDGLRREHRPTQLMLRQVVDMRRQLVELDQQEEIARELERERNALTVLGAVSQAAQNTGGRLRVTNLELVDLQGHSEKSAADGRGAAPSGLRLEGVSLDNPSVAEFLDQLQKSGIFRRVDLLGSKAQQDTSTALRHYEIRCEF